MPEPFFLPAAPARRSRLTACAVVAAFTFACYYGTLLPGLDFGDTAAYQAAVGNWRLTPRQAYPLYFAIANTIFAVGGGSPAYSLNLTSALAGSAACAALVWVASALTGSVLAGAWAGVLLGASYTFWSQAIIAEVYTLHLLLTSLVLAAGIWWTRCPSFPRLALFFGAFAVGFGNHLMMVLLAPALMALIVVTPGGLRQVLSRKGVSLAMACAAVGASQYLWNAAFLWRARSTSRTSRRTGGSRSRSSAQGFFRVAVSYGFMDQPDVPRALALCQAAGLRADPARTSYFIGRETLIPTPRPPLGPVEARVFTFLSAGNLSATTYFGIPPERVVELGAQVEV